MEKIKKHIFYIFLILQVILWTCLSLLRNIASTDAMEAVSWGELISFGTNKHPPFSGWLAGGFFHLLGQNDIALYLLGQICLFVGFIFIYKFAKFFLTEEKAMCSSLIMSVCFYYTYQTYIDNFNCNIISMGLWPVLVYYFYKSIKENKIADWIVFGVFSGIAVLSKYQVAFLFLPMLLYLLICERRQFLQKGLYIAAITGFIVILPHILWLYNHDFFSLLYIMGRTDVATGNTPKALLPFGRIVFPVKFYLDQILAILPCIFMYILLALKEKNISTNFSKENMSDKIFVLLIGILPVFMLGFMGAITNSRIIGTWGSTMLFLAGIILFYFFPINFNKNTFNYFIKLLSTLVILWAIGVGIFASLQTKFVIAYPKKEVMADFDKIWTDKTGNKPLKYVSGDIKLIFQFNIYNKQHPTIILETFGYRNPWIDPKDVISSGALVLDNDEDRLVQIVKDRIALLPENYKISPEKYTINICNKVGQCKKEEFFYAIIPPKG